MASRTQGTRGLRLDVAGLKELIASNRRDASNRRTAFLKQHPDYFECVVAGCEGLVAPRFVRTTSDGQRFGFCPRRQQHAQIAPDAFAA